MFENRSLKLDLVALGLFAFVIFAGLALATYDVADPVSHLIRPLDRFYQPDAIVFPPHQEAANLCGRWGALAADLMLNAFGIGAYYLVLSLAILDVQLLRRRTIDMPIVRGVGWVATLLGLTVIFSLLAPTLSPGPVVGSGGYLGALGASLLQTYFATVGGVILIVSLILGGMLLCTDYTFFRVARFVMMAAMAGLLSGHRRVRRRRSDVDDFEDEVFRDSEDELAVRIRGRKVGSEQGVGLGAKESTLADTKDEIENAEELDEEFEDEEFEEEGFEEEEIEEEGIEESSELMVAGSETQLREDAAEESESLRIRRPQKQEEKSERDEVIDRLNEADRFDDPMDYELPDLDLLMEADDICFESQAKEVRRKAKILERTFADFGFKVKVVEIETGPVIAQYEVQLEAGLRLSKITGLADDLAIALRVPSVRIVAPIPGKNTVGIEVPNEERQVVRLREVIEEANGRTKKMRIPIFLGKDVSGKPLVVDLSTLPHLLIAGRTGTGKSVCLNAIISSILMSRRPDEVRMLMIDPKMVELCGYGRLPHLMHPVVTDMKKAEAILAWAVDKMEERYSLLAQAGVRHISSYNQLGREELIERMQPESEEQMEAIPDQLPFIVIVADEMADLMMTAGKEVEQHIIRLAQKSRAVGIHLILATQKPTVDVITGLIKSNLPARIAFQVASRTDSRVVLDEMGADKLLGNGDMLFLWPGTSTLVRGQGTYLGDDEINGIVESVSTGEQNFVHELVNLKVETDEEHEGQGQIRKRDDLYESAIDVVVREGRGSVSLLQRTLGIGYGRAARLIDFMAEDNIVGPYAGSQAREVMISIAEWEQMQGEESEEAGEMATIEPSAKTRQQTKIISTDWEEEEALEAAEHEDEEEAYEEEEVGEIEEIEEIDAEYAEEEDEEAERCEADAEWEDDQYEAESA